MGLHNPFLLRSMTALLVLSAATFARVHHYTLGIGGSLSNRTGNTAIPSIKISADTVRTPVGMYALYFGKRYGLVRNLEFQGGIDLSFGSAITDTLWIGPPTEEKGYQERHGFVSFIFQPEVLLPLQEAGVITPVLSLGGGAALTGYRERYFVLDGTLQEVRNEEARNLWRWCPTIHGGLALRIRTPADYGVALSYSFRYWHPVRYDNSNGFPLTPLPYTETFRSHAFMVSLLFGIQEE